MEDSLHQKELYSSSPCKDRTPTSITSREVRPDIKSLEPKNSSVPASSQSQPEAGSPMTSSLGLLVDQMCLSSPHVKQPGSPSIQPAQPKLLPSPLRLPPQMPSAGTRKETDATTKTMRAVSTILGSINSRNHVQGASIPNGGQGNVASVMDMTSTRRSASAAQWMCRHRRNRRKRELFAYSCLLDAFRAQGELNWQKMAILEAFGARLNISHARRQEEILRVFRDAFLTRVADGFAKQKVQGTICHEEILEGDSIEYPFTESDGHRAFEDELLEDNKRTLQTSPTNRLEYQALSGNLGYAELISPQDNSEVQSERHLSPENLQIPDMSWEGDATSDPSDFLSSFPDTCDASAEELDFESGLSSRTQNSSVSSFSILLSPEPDRRASVDKFELIDEHCFTDLKHQDDLLFDSPTDVPVDPHRMKLAKNSLKDSLTSTSASPSLPEASNLDHYDLASSLSIDHD